MYILLNTQNLYSNNPITFKVAEREMQKFKDNGHNKYKFADKVVSKGVQWYFILVYVPLFDRGVGINSHFRRGEMHLYF